MKSKSPLTIYHFLAACLVCFLSSGSIIAQERGIYELTNDDELLSKVKVKKHKENSRGKFYDLAQKLHTTAYITNNKVNKVYGKGDIKKINFSDTYSFGILNTKSFNDAELIIITINKVSDFDNVLDLKANNNLNSLKYIFVKCNFKCTKKQIKKFVKANKNSKIRVFYRNESPS